VTDGNTTKTGLEATQTFCSPHLEIWVEMCETTPRYYPKKFSGTFNNLLMLRLQISTAMKIDAEAVWDMISYSDMLGSPRKGR